MMRCSRTALWLTALTGLALAVPVTAQAPTPAPVPGQGGILNGSYRDYDSFLANYRSPSGTAPLPVPPSPVPVSPLRPLGALDMNRSLPGGSAVLQGEGYRAALRRGRPPEWLFQAARGCYYTATPAEDGLTYWWVWFPKEPSRLWCYLPIRTRYVGLYDTARRLYHPYDAVAAKWKEPGVPPVPLPGAMPDPSKKPILAPADVLGPPKPPAFAGEPSGG
jgi:hypothetical protein